MPPRFLLDEHINPAIQRQLRRMIREVDVRCVGDTDAPMKGTLDHDLLAWAAENGFVLISEDRRTLPSAINDRLTRGLHTGGVLFIRPNASLGSVIEQLELIWHLSAQEEFRNATLFIPL